MPKWYNKSGSGFTDKQRKQLVTSKQICQTCKKEFIQTSYNPKLKQFCSLKCNKNITEKYCTSCKIIKSVDKWGKNKASHDGLQSWCIKCRQKKSEEYFEKNKSIIFERNTKYRLKTRLSLLKILGNKCVNCGDTKISHLQIDHINNDGNKERKESNQSGFTQKILMDYLHNKRNIKRLQVLCANCNYEKQLFRGNFLKYIDEVLKEIA